MIYGLIFLFVLLAGFMYLNHIRTTPYGKMELKSALATKLVKEYEGDDIFFFRKQFEKFHKPYDKKLPIAQVEDFKIPIPNQEIPVRFYQDNQKTDLPLIIYIHGGGWCIGSLYTHDEQCRRIAIETQLPVISIDYTLSPEVKYPTALNEVCDVIVYLQENGIGKNLDCSKMAILGDSAGGNLTITVTLKLLKEGKADSIKCIAPIYPVTDCRDGKKGSYLEFDKGYLLTGHLMKLFGDNYIESNADTSDPLLSPILSDQLGKLPPTFVLTAGLDPLRDEGEKFVEEMKKQGGNVILSRYDNCLHGFYGRIELGKKGVDAIKETATFFKEHLTG